MNVTTIVKLNGEQIEVSGLFRDGDFVGMPKMTYKGIDIEPLLADLLVGSVFPAREKADEYVSTRVMWPNIGVLGRTCRRTNSLLVIPVHGVP